MNKIIDHMYQQDAFSQWLGIRTIDAGSGYCELELEIRPEMVNGLGIAHGAITYALADSALAFASNSHGRKAVSIETTINHLMALQVGDIIKARTEETSLSYKLGIYHIRITRGEELVAHFRGIVYRKSEAWNVV